MANFGLSQLKVVAPYEPHWREAKSAVGAPQILKEAVVSNDLAAAVRDCTFVAGTGTLSFRKPEQEVLQLPSLPAVITNELARGGRVALVFGPEKHGLTREDLSLCQVLVEIPTDARQPSMNLGQAAAVCFYELAAHTTTARDAPASPHPPPTSVESSTPAAAAKNLDLLAGLVEQVMDAAHYSPASMRHANRHDLRLMLRRLAPTEKDVRRMLGLFRRILWKLEGRR